MRSNEEKTIFYHNLSLNTNRESSRRVLEILDALPERTRTNYIETAILAYDQMESTKEAILEFMENCSAESAVTVKKEKSTPVEPDEQKEKDIAAVPDLAQETAKRKKRELDPSIISCFTDSLI